jgi:hypothetical protein
MEAPTQASQDGPLVDRAATAANGPSGQLAKSRLNQDGKARDAKLKAERGLSREPRPALAGIAGLAAPLPRHAN